MNHNELTEQGTVFLKDKRYGEAIEYYEQAAEEGDFMAMYNLACMHYFGDGVEVDEKKAFDWFLKAGDHGDAEATNRVGIMCEQGIGTEEDIQSAFHYYRKSAEMGSLSGMANLALAYLEGKGCEVSVEEGLLWMKKASEGGNGVASLTLGNYFHTGTYVTRDDVKACSYYERGMDQKYAPAIYQLAEMTKNGYGVTRNLDEAVRLKKLADETPDED